MFLFCSLNPTTPSLTYLSSSSYVDIAHATEDTEVLLSVRGKLLPAKVTKMPFVATDYFKAV